MEAGSPKQAAKPAAKPELREVLPKAGLVYSERGVLTEVLCKPKILPLKSVVLEQLEQIERADAEAVQESEELDKAKSGGLYKDR